MDGDRNFKERISDVFGSLDSSLKTFTDSPMKGDPEEIDSLRSQSKYSRPRSKIHKDRDKQGSYPRDRSPTYSRIERGRNLYRRSHPYGKVPDYVKNPDKWIKYDLKEDGTENFDQTTLSDDQKNRQTAYQFLEELRSRKSHPNEEEKPYDKIVFKKPNKLKKGKESDKFIGRQFEKDKCHEEKKKKTEKEIFHNDSFNCNPLEVHGLSTSDSETGYDSRSDSRMRGQFTGGVFKMPEYVVGMDVKKKKASYNKVSSQNQIYKLHSKNIHLRHLDEEND